MPHVVPRDTGDRDLEALIRLRIQEDGPMPFDEYMSLALYHPHFGYYSRPGAGLRAGGHGDFVTAPTLTPYFGAALADFVAEAWLRLGKPPSWSLVEAGGGTGALLAPLAATIQERHPGAFHGMHVTLVDRNPMHRDTARAAVDGLLAAGRFQVTEDLPDTSGAPTVVLANELWDNLPVRLLVQRKGAWRERTVGLAGDRFDWVERDPPADLVAWADGCGFQPPDDHQVEAPVGLEDWFDALDAAWGDTPLVLLAIDYGEVARDLFVEPRAYGTVMAYEGHAQDRDVLQRPGHRDVTAHVNFTAAARIAEDQDWTLLGYTTQTSFLMRLGLMEAAAALGQDVGSPEQMAAFQALKDVLLPGGMGEAFKVLGLVRNVPPGEGPWRGFEDTRPIDPRPRTA